MSGSTSRSKRVNRRSRSTTNGDSVVTLSSSEKNRLVDSLRSSVEAKTKGRKTPRRTLEDAFREIDIDKSETVSMEEFIIGTKRFLQGVPLQKVRALFHVFDVSKNGQLTLNNFIQNLLEGDIPKENTGTDDTVKVHFKRAAEAPSPKAARKAVVARANRSLEAARGAVAPYFNEDRPELRPNASKIGARTQGPRGTYKKPSSAAERKRKLLADRSIAQLREKIVERGGTTGIQSLSRVMKIMDDSGDRKLSKEELKYGLQDYGMPLSSAELEDLFQIFDADGSGSISFNEFLLRLANPMNTRRVNLVDKAFNILDCTGDGTVTVEDIMKTYDVSLNPEVIAGKITADEAFRAFLDAFDSGEKDGIVTRDEFRDYYRLISAAIDSDDYFELMLRNAWHMSGGKGQAASTTCRRVLVTHEDGHQTVEEITDDLGIAVDDIREMKRNLRRRGIKARAIQTYGASNSKVKQKESGGGASKFSRAKEEAKARARQDRTTIKPAPFATSAPTGTRSSTRSSNRSNRVSVRGASRGSSSNGSNGDDTTKSKNPSRKPTPSLRQLRPIVKRCHQDILERARSVSPEYQATLMSRYDRMQYHLNELDTRLAEIMLQRAIQRRNVDGRTNRLDLVDFGHVLRAFTFEGQRPINEKDMTTFWRGCNGGDVDILVQKIFHPSREENMVGRENEQVMESEFINNAKTRGQEDVGDGPFDFGHFGERIVADSVLNHWPKRMRYRYSNTPVQAPTDFDSQTLVQRSAQLPTDADLELEWVYGNNGKCFDNIHVSARGELVYHKAAIVVLHDVPNNKQRHFMYHDDDITCLDVDASGTIGASGQMGANPRICVFDLDTFDVLAVLGGQGARHVDGFFERSVCAVSFCSVDSGYIMGVGDDNHHSLGVWKWKLNKTELEGLTMHGLMSTGEPCPGKLICESGTMNGEPPQIYNIVVPERNMSGGNNSRNNNRSRGSSNGGKIQRFCTVGNSHTKFWSVDLNASINSGSNPISVRNSRYNNSGKRMPRKTMCAAYCPDGITAITGGSDGTCYIWDTQKGECIQTFNHHPIKRHTKVDKMHKPTAVQAIAVMTGENRNNNKTFTVVTGGVDGTVRRIVLSPASRGKNPYSIDSTNGLVCNLGKEYRGMREAVRASNMDEPDTIIAPRPSEHKISFKTKKSDKGRGDPSRGQGDGAGTENGPKNTGAASKGKADRAKKRAEADAGLLGGPSVLRARHAVTALEVINGTCYVSTRRGDVWTIDPTQSKVKQAVQSHFGPVYGACPHPTIPTRFATAGEDRLLCVWDGHKQVCSQYLPTLARSCTYSPDGNFIAVGCHNGAVLIYRFQKAKPRAGVYASLIFFKVVQDCVESIDDLKYSPDGTMLAVGSHDNFVDVYLVQNNMGVGSSKKKGHGGNEHTESYVRISRCRGHTSYITHIDWSVDSRVIQSNCGAYEIMYWDAESGQPILSSTDTVEADTNWSSWTCVLGFPVMGVWPEYTDGTDVNSVHISSDGKHLVTGYVDFISLFFLFLIWNFYVFYVQF
jgi:Ca2+-binding EF-hand superfamily protein/WD40 repeat protein